MATHKMLLDSVKLTELLLPATAGDIAALAAVGLVSTAYLLRGIAWDKPDPYRHLWYERPQLRDGFAVSQQRVTRNIAERLDETNKDVVIFWGSQSGTAESFASRLARECHTRFGLGALSADLSDFDADTISLIPGSKVAIFLLSTYGEGDPSDNATSFWEWLHQEVSTAVRLNGLKYVAFGLGNSNYKYYNRVLDETVRILDEAGTESLFPAGKADAADGSTEETFHAWKEEMFDVVFREKLGLQERGAAYTPGLSIVEDPSLSQIDLHLGEPIDLQKGASTSGTKLKTTAIRPLKLQSARQLCTAPGVSCVHLELDLTDHPELRYRTGDHLAVYPVNPDIEVRLLLQALGMDNTRATTPLLLNPAEKGDKLALPSPTTALALFRHYLEICAPVSQDALLELASFAPTPDAREYLRRLGKEKEAYAALVTSTHVTIGRLLSIAAPDAVWRDLPLSYLLETIQPMQPRYYSIASSSAVTPRQVAITVAVQNTPLPAAPSKTIPGLASNHLLTLTGSVADNTNATAVIASAEHPDPIILPSTVPGHLRVFGRIRQSKFKLPTLGTTPLVMVAAGTGVAPFRGFLLERARLKRLGKLVGPMMLFFGCRWLDGDFLYKEELDELAQGLGDTLEIVTAISRGNMGVETSGEVKGKYVQHKIRERGDRVCEMLSSGDANLYICGRAAMAREVAAVVEELMKKWNKWNDEDVQEWTRRAKRENKWLQDVWG
ncbi:hypothetical protein VTK73DRAFT_10036 [Phialemonium thermophilum]|uniref:NADPH--hemoprotein reductase n=1 Tax=Phialemonium thermophilum TaxID=223376 RepID=A0ABR3XIF7_9PEZI